MEATGPTELKISYSMACCCWQVASVKHRFHSVLVGIWDDQSQPGKTLSLMKRVGMNSFGFSLLEKTTARFLEVAWGM